MSSQNLDSDVIETRHSFKDDVSIIEISSSDTSPETPSPRVSQSRYSTKYSAGRVPLIQTVTPLSHQSSSRKRKAQSPCNIDASFTEIFDESRDEDYIPTQLSPIPNISRRKRKNIESASFTEIINSEDEDFVPTQPYTQPKMPSKKRKSRLRKLWKGSVFENICLGLIRTPFEYSPDSVKLSMVKQACKDSNAWDFIEKMPKAINSEGGPRKSLLSVGRKQRIAIVRAIVKQLKILLLDEASSVLDKSEVLVQQVLDCASKNRSTINLIKNWCRLKGILLQLSAVYVVLIVENKDDWR